MTDRRRAGFTLVEVLIALAVLAIAGAFAFRAVSGGFFWLDRDDGEQHAVLIAQAELARIGHEIPLHDGTIDGHTEDGFTWRIAISPYGRPVAGVEGHRVAIAVAWVDGRQARKVALETVRLGAAAGSR